MKKRLLAALLSTLMVMALLPATAFAGVGDTFTVQSTDPTPVDVTMKILSEPSGTDLGTVQVGNGTDAAIGTGISSVTLPEEIVRPGSTERYGVTAVADKAFMNQTDLRSVNLPKITAIVGDSVYRTNATTATVRFYSNEQGTCYYTVDGNPTTTIDALRSGKNAGAVTANATTALEIDPDLLSSGAKYIHIVVVEGSDTQSNVLNIFMPYDVYYFDDFEAYANNTLVPATPANITTSTPQMYTKYNGGSADNQKVILSNDNVLQTIGSYGKGLDIRANLPSSIDSGYVVFEADMLQTTFSDTAETVNAGLILGKEDREERPISVVVDRGTHKFVAQYFEGSKQSSDIVCTLNKTYHVRMEINLTDKNYDYFVDGVKANSSKISFSADSLSWFGVFNGASTAHFENIKFYPTSSLAYTVTYDTKGGSAITAGSYRIEDTSFILPTAPTKKGYTFAGWKVTSGAMGGSGFVLNDTFSGTTRGLLRSYGDVTLTAQWIANTNTAYKVEHYVMDTDGNWSTTATKTEDLTGTSDASLTLSELKDTALEVTNGIVYSHGEVDGSTVTTTTVLPDGSRVIKLYYSRNQHTLTLVKGTGIDNVAGISHPYFGQQVMISAQVSHDYTWEKWTSSNTALLAGSTTKNYAFNMPAGDVTLTASAKPIQTTSVWIWGKELTSDNPYYHNGENGAQGTVDNDSDDYNAYFDATNATLTLNALYVKGSTATKTQTIDNKNTTFTYAVFADSDLAINVTGNGDSEVSTGAAVAENANVALGVKGDLTFTGSHKLTAIANKGVSTVGVYILGDLEISSGGLEGRVDQLAGSETTSIAESFGVNVMGDLTVSGGSLTGNGGTATAIGNSISAGIGADDVTVSDGSLTATSGTATAAYALSYGLYASSFDIQGGETNTQGGASTGGDHGSFSAGAAAFDVTVSSGSLTAEGGHATATGGAFSQSSGIYTEADSISFSGGTVKATGDEAGSDSCGIMNAGNRNRDGEYVDGGVIAVSGTADVEANGGDAEFCYGLVALDGITVTGGSVTGTAAAANDCSYGVNAPNGSISVTGGTLTAKTTDDSGTRSALNKALSLGTGIEAKGSTSSDGSSPVNYEGANNASYMWVSVTPTPTVVSVAVNPASVSIQKGGTQTFNATVTGKYDPAQTVTWTVEGGVAGTSISSNGVLTVAANETATTLTVKATSTVDTAKSGTATVTVKNPIDPDPVEYKIIKGQDGDWVEGGTGGLGFTADGDYDMFTGVSVDGTALSSDKYTSQSGSTIVTLKASYLKTLSVGQHTLRINFTDGYAETHFTIKAATNPSIPATGDSSQPLLWLGIALLACAALATSFVLARRKQHNG